MTLGREQRPFVREVGAGDGVVCIHSSAGSSAQWRPLMDHLAGDFHVLAPDLYGSGKSPAWPSGRALSLDDEVGLLGPVLDSAGARFHLIGHSYGGAVALRASLLHRERIASLVLIEPVPFALLLADDPGQPAAREIVELRDATTAAVERGDPAGAAARFVDYWSGRGAWAATPAPRRAVIAKAMSKAKAEWHALFADPTPLAALATLEVETTLVVGSRSPASSLALARLVGRTMPRLTRVELAGAGHMAPLTHPDAVDAVIAAHLAGRRPHPLGADASLSRSVA